MAPYPRKKRDCRGKKSRRKKSGYIVFYMSLLEAYPKCIVTTVAKKAGLLWKNMNPCEKEEYNQMAKQPPKKRTCRGCQANLRAGRGSDDCSHSGESSTASLHESVKRVVSNAGGKEKQRESHHQLKESVAESRKRYVSMCDNCNCRKGLYNHDQPGTSTGRMQDHKMHSTITVVPARCCCRHEAQTFGDHESAQVVKLRCPCGLAHNISVADMKRGRSKLCQCGRVAGPLSQAPSSSRYSCCGCCTKSSMQQHRHRLYELTRCREATQERHACCSRPPTESRSRATECVDETKKRMQSNSSRCCCGKQGCEGQETPVKRRRQDDESTSTKKQTATRNNNTTANNKETSEKKNKHNSAWYM